MYFKSNEVAPFKGKFGLKHWRFIERLVSYNVCVNRQQSWHACVWATLTVPKLLVGFCWYSQSRFVDYFYIIDKESDTSVDCAYFFLLQLKWWIVELLWQNHLYGHWKIHLQLILVFSLSDESTYIYLQLQLADILDSVILSYRWQVYLLVKKYWVPTMNQLLWYPRESP